MSVPIYEPTLFSSEALHNPFEHYKAIRELGPVVFMNKPKLRALSRYDDVKTL